MKLYFDKNTLEKNKFLIQKIAQIKALNVAYMLKSPLLKDFILSSLSGEKIYTTKNTEKAINIYADENISIIDAFDRREGISIASAKKLVNKNTAIVNFCCCGEKIPKETDLSKIASNLYKIGFFNISFGGSMLLNYSFSDYDEIRTGEAFLTGYSTIFKKYFDGFNNPFSLELDVLKTDKDRILLNAGFLEIGGFTDVNTICVNTDITVIEGMQARLFSNNSKILLNPDYYTLMKLANKGLLDTIE